jgi:hypothetical protein
MNVHISVNDLSSGKIIFSEDVEDFDVSVSSSRRFSEMSYVLGSKVVGEDFDRVVVECFDISSKGIKLVFEGQNNVSKSFVKVSVRSI